MVVTIDNGENFKIESYDPISKHHCKLTSTERPQPVAAESVGKSAGAVGTNLDVRAAQQTSGTRSYASNFDHHSLATPPHDPACMVPKLVIISAKMADTWYDAPCTAPLSPLTLREPRSSKTP